MKLLVSDNVAEILRDSIVRPIVNALRIHKLLQLVQIYDSKLGNYTRLFIEAKEGGKTNTLLQLLLQLQ